MSLLSTYRKYAPFTADRLIDAANAILTSGGAPTLTKRTLRFYTAQSVVPRPLGSPKFARYGYEHLLSLLSARALQDQGMKLHQIISEVEEAQRGHYARLEGLVDNWLSSSFAGGAVREVPVAYDEANAAEAKVGVLNRSISLTPNATLHVVAGTSLKQELERVSEALNSVLKQL